MRQTERVSRAEEVRGQHSSPSSFRPDIEGLRAVAVLVVVLFHAQVPGIGGGYIGVDVFFVISGFLITGLLWREANVTGTVQLSRFYGARARRLLPASAIVGVMIMIGAAVLLPPLRSRAVMGDGIASALYVSNYRFILQHIDYLAINTAPSPFEHYWSLGVEEQFYLVWPALIIGTAWLTRRACRRKTAQHAFPGRPFVVVLALVAIVSFVLSLVYTTVMPPVAFFSLPTRSWELALGGLVALTECQWHRLPPRAAMSAGWAGLGMVLVASTWLGRATPYPGTAALLPVLGTALVIGAGCSQPSRGCGRLLGLAPMRTIGRVSYSWYLWHWPVLLVALWSVAPMLGGHARMLALGGILLSLGLAFATQRFIENPLRFATRLRQSAKLSLALGGAATAVTVGVGTVLYAPDPVGHGPATPALTVNTAPVPSGSSVDAYDAAVQRAFAQVQAAVATSAGLIAVPSNLDPPLVGQAKEIPRMPPADCLRGIFQDEQPECATGDTASSTTTALVGDSVAFMWGPALQQVAEERHWRLETLSKGACPMLDLPTTNPIDGREYTACEHWRGQILARLQAARPRLVVLSVLRRYGAPDVYYPGFTSYDAAWTDSLTRMVRQMRGTGAQVLVLGPIPDPHTDVRNCLSVHLDDARACSPSRSTAVNKPGIAAEATATRAAGGHYADLTDLFCTVDRCPVIVGNTLVYQDQNHLTAQFSQLLAPVIGALADRALAHA